MTSLGLRFGGGGATAPLVPPPMCVWHTITGIIKLWSFLFLQVTATLSRKCVSKTVVGVILAYLVKVVTLTPPTHVANEWLPIVSSVNQTSADPKLIILVILCACIKSFANSASWQIKGRK